MTQLNCPPINGHLWLSSLYGSLPSWHPYSVKLAKYIPSTWIQSLIEARVQLRDAVMSYVKHAVETTGKDELAHKTLLTHLIAATDPETGEKLTLVDLSSEAFGFLIAGSHTTAATLTLPLVEPLVPFHSKTAYLLI